jgi:YHS domain-containing protein
MKKLILFTAVVIGAALFTVRLTAADSAMPSCCGGAPTKTVADAKAKPDLLTTCPVSGEKLGEMGKPFTFTYKNQEVKLCCKGCKKDFDKNPEKYLKFVRAADKQ